MDAVVAIGSDGHWKGKSRSTKAYQFIVGTFLLINFQAAKKFPRLSTYLIYLGTL